MGFNFIDWIKGKPQLSLTERNKRKEDELSGLEKEVVATEKGAELAERKAKLQERLDAASLRCEKAKRNGGIGMRGMLKWLMIVAVVALILFAIFRGC